MDLIMTSKGNDPFTVMTENEYNILSFPGVQIKDGKFITKDDWKHQALKSYKRLHEIKNIWGSFTSDQKVKESHYFYDCVFRCRRSSNSKTEWINTELIDSDGKIRGYTADHPFSARIVIRIIMSDWPSFMGDLDEYATVIDFITQTIGVTPKENQDVKVITDNNGEIKIKELTKDKYSGFTFRNKNTNEVKHGLPFEIPEWFEQGEIKRLFTSDELRLKELNKMKCPQLREEANILGISIKKEVNGKNKTKKELIDEIINHNDQAST